MVCADYRCAQAMRCVGTACKLSGIPPLRGPLDAPRPQQGWACPKCGSVWAPFMPGCTTCNNSTPRDPSEGGV